MAGNANSGPSRVDRSILEVDVPLQIAAELFHVTPAHIVHLTRAGALSANDSGSYRLGTLTYEFLKKSLADQRFGRTDADQEAKRLKIEQMRLALQVQRGELVELDEVFDAVDVTVGKLFSELESLPAMYTRDLKERKKLLGILNSIRKRYAVDLRKSIDVAEEAAQAR